jgi:hypothetical protein
MLMLPRSSNLHHARPPLRNLRPLPLQRWPGSCFRRPRRKYPILVSGKAYLHPRHRLPPGDAGRGCLRRCLESRWPACRKCRRRWCCQGLCSMMTRARFVDVDSSWVLKASCYVDMGARFEVGYPGLPYSGYYSALGDGCKESQSIVSFCISWRGLWVLV